MAVRFHSMALASVPRMFVLKAPIGTGPYASAPTCVVFFFCLNASVNSRPYAGAPICVVFVERLRRVQIKPHKVTFPVVVFLGH